MIGPYRGQPSRSGAPLRCSCGALATHRAVWRSNGTGRGSTLYCAACVAAVRDALRGAVRPPDVIVELAAWHYHVAESLRARRLAREAGQVSSEPTLFQIDSDTSRAAAERAPLGLRDLVYRAVQAAHEHGRTEEELNAELGLEGSTTRPRIVELLEAGRLVRSNRKRATSSGRWAYVYVDALMLEPGDRWLLTGKGWGE